MTQEIVPDGEVIRSDYFPIGTINEFQFAYAMRDAFRNANGASPSTIPTMMGTWNNWGGTWGFVQPTNATVFVNNWDTERNGGSLDASNYTGATNDTQGSHRYDLANIFMPPSSSDVPRPRSPSPAISPQASALKPPALAIAVRRSKP